MAAESIALTHFKELVSLREDESSSVLSEPSDLPDSVVSVTDVEFYSKQNARLHHTHRYELVDEHSLPVMRRGQTFLIGIRTDKPWSADRNNLTIVFQFGNSPNVPDGTKIILPLTNESHIDLSDTKHWAIQLNVSQASGSVLVVEVFSPTTALVGAYNVLVTTSSKDIDHDVRTFSVQHPLYLLFNPYCQDDQVHMAAENDLEEYIQADSGKVWVGTYRRIRSRPWAFGQFDDTVLPAACLVLDNSTLAPRDRGDPIKVSRAISAMVNDIDDRGILSGNWSGDYRGGVAPWTWTGTADILDQYVQGGGRPVKYGQCWVFSGVVTTICRVLGLPCRSVTNFSSGHDTNASLTIDKFFSQAGEKLARPVSGSRDSVWNFHVWNDVFMARPDLPAGYGGWQAIDATPQELSQNKFQCGPASVEAVRRGMIGLTYDVPFLFAEVNADMCHFVEDDESNWGFTRSNAFQAHVGRAIVTTAAGQFDPLGNSDLENITAQYKSVDGGEEERWSVFNAVSGNSTARKIYSYVVSEDVVIDMQDMGQVNFGQQFKARINLKNTSNETRTLQASVGASSIYYNGIIASLVKKATGTFLLQPQQEEVLALTVAPEEYMGKVVEYCMFKVVGMIRVVETNQTWSEEDDFLMDKPKLFLELEGEAKRRTVCNLKVTFSNPLDEILTDCSFSIEAAGVLRKMNLKFRDVEAEETVSTVLRFYPRRSGSTKLICRFNSKQLVDVNGTLTLRIVH